VVLLRQGSDGVETFLMRRHDAIAFMGGAHVFPGGRVEPSDCDLRYTAVADGVEAIAARMPAEPPDAALGFHVAAIRETFEEAAVLLARTSDGAPVSLPDVNEAIRHRQSVAAGATALLDLAREAGWRLALDELVYFAHWVTPRIESRRFDTRFFLAVAPVNQIASHDAAETTEGVWLRPSHAIARCLEGEIALPPPTWTTLRWLEPFATVDDACAWAREKPVPRIEPGFIVRGESRLVTLPGDPTVAAVAGFEAKETRFLLTAGRWTPIPAEPDE